MKFKSSILFSILAITCSFSCFSCAEKGVDEEQEEIQYIDDKYGNYYQIFPYSFADSNGDGIGDIKGIIDKFDYIKSLNYSGLWLTPVHQSPSYHKYDVTDYKSIDSSFGTLTDYDNLVSLCHDNHMKIILDLVFNHSSDQHIWFQKCLASHIRKQTSDQYYNYYNFVDLSGSDATPSGYTRYNSTLAYESRFYSGMPDLNLGEVLDNPTGYLATDLKEIISFWLKDHKVDGFRLDAVTSYFTNDVSLNTKFLTWLNDECRKINPNCFIVAEGSWGNNNENQTYGTSGINGCFQFDNARADGNIARAVTQSDATFLRYGIEKNEQFLADNPNAVALPFVANHDIGRLTNMVIGKGNPNNVKLAHGVLQLMNGTTFSYYGDEVGMTVCQQTSTNAKDEDKRQPLPWGDNYTCISVKGSTKATDEEKYSFGTIANQDKDSNSILNYVRKANLLRLQNPEIARGKVEKVYTDDTDSFCVISKTYNNKTIYIALNCAKNKEKTFDYSSLNISKIAGTLTTSSVVKYGEKEKTIIIPPMGIAILR